MSGGRENLISSILVLRYLSQVFRVCVCETMDSTFLESLKTLLFTRSRDAVPAELYGAPREKELIELLNILAVSFHHLKLRGYAELIQVAAASKPSCLRRPLALKALVSDFRAVVCVLFIPKKPPLQRLLTSLTDLIFTQLRRKVKASHPTGRATSCLVQSWRFGCGFQTRNSGKSFSDHRRLRLLMLHPLQQWAISKPQVPTPSPRPSHKLFKNSQSGVIMVRLIKKALLQFIKLRFDTNFVKGSMMPSQRSPVVRLPKQTRKNASSSTINTVFSRFLCPDIIHAR